MTTVLILGGGIMQTPAVRIAKNKGWRVVVADADPGAMARESCDEFHLVDLKDRDGIADLAGRLKAKDGLDGIFTAGTDFSSTVAWAAEKLGLPGISYRTAMTATDKCMMRAAFGRKGVPSPRYARWDGGEDPVTAASGIPFPVVVKPVDNMGARGVKRVEDRTGLGEACREAIELSRSRKVIIEQFMEGPELSLDAVVHRGRMTTCGIADRHICFPPYFVEMGHTMPTELDGETVREVEEVFAAGIKAIGIDNGAAKGDIKLTESGPMVGEIAARLSGGYMSGWTYPISTGVEVTAAALNIAVGLPPGDLRPRWRKVAAERAFISIPGRVAGIEGLEEARKVPGVREIFLRAASGGTVVFPKNNVQKCGNVIACGESREAAAAGAQDALARISIRLHPLEPDTTEFIFGEGFGTDGFDAFALKDGENGRFFSSMPPFFGNDSGAAGGSVIRVIALPNAGREQGRDWHGRTFSDAMACVVKKGGVEFVSGFGGGDFVLGKAFWRSFLRGGAQGALYLLDSLRAARITGRLGELISTLWG